MIKHCIFVYQTSNREFGLFPFRPVELETSLINIKRWRREHHRSLSQKVGVILDTVYFLPYLMLHQYILRKIKINHVICNHTRFKSFADLRVSKALDF